MNLVRINNSLKNPKYFHSIRVLPGHYYEGKSSRYKYHVLSSWAGLHHTIGGEECHGHYETEEAAWTVVKQFTERLGF